MSKKFTLVRYCVRQGEHEYFDYYSYYTSDFQKMNKEQLVAHFYEHRLKRLKKFDPYVYEINSGERTSYVYSSKQINLTEHETLENLGILDFKPEIIFPKINNIIQLNKRRKNDERQRP